MSTASDNITLNQGSGGPVVHTDYVSSKGHFQYVKLDIGTDGNSTPITSTQALPIQIADLPANWTTVPVAGGTNGQGIAISGVINVADVGISNGTLDRLIEVKNGVTLGSIASGVVMGIQSPASSSVNIAATAGDVQFGIAGGVTVASGGGTIDQVVLVKGVDGVTLASTDGVTFAVETTATPGQVSITTGSNTIKANVVETAAPSDITTGIKFVTIQGASSGDSAVTLPTFASTNTIEFFNLPGSGTGGVGNATNAPLGGMFNGSLTAGFGGLADQQVGAIIVLGVTGATVAHTSAGVAGGITLGYLAASAGFQLIFPGEKVKIPFRDLNDFVFQCMTGPNGETGAALQFVATKH